MRIIKKKIVTDEESRPVAVQIDYEDWLEIERALAGGERDDSEYILDRAGELWEGGEGLEYQEKLRGEWENRR